MPPATRKQPARSPTTGSKFIPFDHLSEELVCDWKGLATIPFDIKTYGLTTLRALIMPRNKFVHVPSVPGHYCMAGMDDPKTATALTKVYFTNQTREPELLLGFQDFGMANSELLGVSVFSVKLPLQSGKDTQISTSITPVKEVKGFESFDETKLPWSSSLSSWLNNFEAFKEIGITNQATMHAFIEKPLKPRMEALQRNTMAALDKEMQGLASQDPRAASQKKQVFASSVNQVVKKLYELNLDLYDKPMMTRVTHISATATEGSTTGPLSTPLAMELRAGRAAAQFTTLFAPAPAPAPSPIRALQPFQPSPAPAPAPSAGEGSAANAPLASPLPATAQALSPAPSLQRLADSPDSADLGKRRRIGTNMYVPGETLTSPEFKEAKEVQGKGKGKAPAGSAPATTDAPYGYFPMDYSDASKRGKPRARPAYNTTASQLNQVKASNPATALAAAGTDMDKDKKTIKALKEKLTEHEHKIEHLKCELEFEREAVKRVTQEKLAEINAAEAKLRQQYADDKLESFKDGMKAAVAMMKP